MSVGSPQDRALSRRGNLMYALIVIAAYAVLLLSPEGALSSGHTALLLALGVVYYIIGTTGLGICERRGGLLPLLAYFAVQLALCGVIINSSQFAGALWLLPLPLVSQAVITLPFRWMVAVAVAALAVLLIEPLLTWAFASALSIALTMSASVFFVIVFTQIAVNERRARAEVERLAGELRAANRKLSALAVQAGDLATMQERNRLAREIHDGLGHYLTAINMQIQAGRAVLAKDPERTRAALDTAQTLTQDALADVRRSVSALRLAPTEQRPLLEAIAPLIQENRAAGIVTELTVTGQPRRLSAQADLTLYRAVQEALTNVRKHARASRVDIALDYSQIGQARLAVSDNGIGGPTDSPGFGLQGLHERVQLVGGQMRLQSSPQQGFRLEVEAPG